MKSHRMAVANALLCAGSLAALLATRADLAAPADPVGLSLPRRAQALRADIEAEYRHLRAIKALPRSSAETLDVTAAVRRDLEGLSLGQAKAIALAAGCSIAPAADGRLSARTVLGGVFDRKYVFALDLAAPRAQPDGAPVEAIAAKLYLLYVPNADRR